jgi:hypothetical protein
LCFGNEVLFGVLEIGERKMSSTNLKAALLTTVILVLLCGPLTGHAQYSHDFASMIGEPSHAHMLPVRFGMVNLENGNLHLEIPLYSLPERGGSSYDVKLIYDSYNWELPQSRLTLRIIIQRVPDGAFWRVIAEADL